MLKPTRMVHPWHLQSFWKGSFFHVSGYTLQSFEKLTDQQRLRTQPLYLSCLPKLDLMDTCQSLCLKNRLIGPWSSLSLTLSFYKGESSAWTKKALTQGKKIKGQGRTRSHSDQDTFHLAFLSEYNGTNLIFPK